jgi:hypothetical protein
MKKILLLLTIFILTLNFASAYKLEKNYTKSEFLLLNLSKANLEPTNYYVIDDHNVGWQMFTLNKKDGVYDRKKINLSTYFDDKTLKECNNKCLDKKIKARQNDYEKREINILKKEQIKLAEKIESSPKKNLLTNFKDYVTKLFG